MYADRPILLLINLDSVGYRDIPVEYLSRLFNYNIHFTEERIPIKESRIGRFRGDLFLNYVIKIKNRFGADYAAGFTAHDLYVPGLNFIFGIASTSSGACTVSVYRLKNENRELFKIRLIKETVHELGHAIFGLKHCGNNKCVMSFSNSIIEVDLKKPEFCDKCLHEIRRNFPDALRTTG